MSYISDKLRQKIVEQSGNRCGYCLGEQRYIFAPLEVDHLLPIAEGGTDDEENLWLACPLCNSYKGKQTHVIDFLLRPIETHQSELPLCNFRHTRSGSPVFGFSILITSAPNPASCEAQNGPASSCPISNTFKPLSGLFVI